ncbi:hypothetical protein C8R46DRAFT_1058618 [Mycena filopes]|nr:hypothetical protein C8R46DRAFT_1058618 [Mycena filopes]
MANLTRSAKSGKDWTEYDLMAYNTSINIQDQNLQDFFGVAAVEALPDVPASLNAIGQEAAFDLFAEKLLDRLGYSQGRHITLIQQALPLLICGSVCSGQTDVCVLNSSTEILLLFQRNNFIRERQLHLPMLDQMVFPAITMRGTGLFPVATTVFCHIPRVPGRNIEGMKNLANRSGLLRYLVAFKQFVVRVFGGLTESPQFATLATNCAFWNRTQGITLDYLAIPLTSWDDPKSRRGHSDRPITTIIDSSVFKILEQQFLNCSNFSGVDWQKELGNVRRVDEERTSAAQRAAGTYIERM